MHAGEIGENIRQELDPFFRRDPLLSLRARERVDELYGEDIGRKQLDG